MNCIHSEALFYFAENQIDTNLLKVLFLNRYDREIELLNRDGSDKNRTESDLT